MLASAVRHGRRHAEPYCLCALVPIHCCGAQRSLPHPVCWLQALSCRWARIRKQGVVQWACACLRAAPGIRGLLATETTKIRCAAAQGSSAVVLFKLC